MTRTAQPRFRADIRLVIDIGAVDEADAEERLAAVQQFVSERLGRSTFQRLPGRPTLDYADLLNEPTPL